MLGYLPIPNAFGLFGSSFFQQMPLSLPIGTEGEPAFTVPFSVWIGKSVYAAIGVILMFLGVMRKFDRTQPTHKMKVRKP